MNLARARVGVTRVWPAFPPARFHWAAPALIAAASVTAYGPFFDIPLLPDDYLQTKLALEYGAPSGWVELARDPLYRCRSTSLVLTWILLQSFGLSSAAYSIASLFLHILNATMVYLLGRVHAIGWKVSAIAALVFAIRERHHEAVVWFASIPELLVFFFSAAAVLSWLEWIDNPKRTYWWLALGSFALALLSKESAAVLPAVMLVFAWRRRSPRNLAIAIAPFVALSAIYTLGAFAAKQDHQHFQDGTFSLHAPVVSTMIASIARGFWIWGGAALLVLTATRRWPRYLAYAAAWIALSMLPYSFLTYMPSIPSRHHYLASAGFALFLAAGIRQARASIRWTRFVPVILALYLFHQAGYLWISKRRSFLKRAEPIESILTFLDRDARRPVYITCFPFSIDEAQRAIEFRRGEPASAIRLSTNMPPPEGAPTFCYE